MSKLADQRGTLIKLKFSLQTDFLNACDQNSDGEIVTTEKAEGILVAMRRVSGLLKDGDLSNFTI